MAVGYDTREHSGVDVGPDTEQENPRVGRSPRGRGNAARANQMGEDRRVQLTAEWGAFSYEVRLATVVDLELDEEIIMGGFLPRSQQTILQMLDRAGILQHNREAEAGSQTELRTIWQELEGMATNAETLIDTQKSRYDFYVQQAGTSFWGGAETLHSEWLGNADLPDLSLYNNAQRCIERLRSQASRADLTTIDGMERTLSSTESHVNRWVEAMNIYTANREENGDRAVKHLTWTRDGAFTALAGLAATGVSVAVGAEAVGARMAISGGMAVATSATKGVVVQGAEIQAGLRSEWDVAAIARSAVIGGVASFLATGVGSWAMGDLAKWVKEDSAVWLVDRFGARVSESICNQSAAALSVFIKDMLTDALKPAFVEILEHCSGKDEMTPEEFIEQMTVRMGSKILTNLAMALGGLHQ